MLPDDRKASVDNLSDDELGYEVERGRASRFQRELYDYARVQLQARRDGRQLAAGQEAVDVAKASVKVAEEGVKVARQNRTATHIGWVVVLGVGVATILVMCTGGK
jgi:hypothetical protein